MLEVLAVDCKFNVRVRRSELLQKHEDTGNSMASRNEDTIFLGPNSN